MILVRNLRLAPEQPLDALRGPAAKKLRIPELEIKELKQFQEELLQYFRTEHRELMEQIEEKKALDEETEAAIIAAVRTFKDR